MVASWAARDASRRWNASSNTFADMTACGSVTAPPSPGIGSPTTRRAERAAQNLKPILPSIVRGRVMVSAGMNWFVEVYVLLITLVKFSI